MDLNSPVLAVSPQYVVRLAVKLRGVQAQEAMTDPDPASNATDDNAIDALQEGSGDLSREEVREEIVGLDGRQQNELVALMWVGRGDFEPEEWDAAVAAAAERREIPTDRYLLGEPLAADYWAEGLERLGIEVPAADQVSESE